MRRTYIISDWFFRLTHAVRRNRGSVIVYALLTLVFIIVGIAIGANIPDKVAYITMNRAPLFAYLRGDSGAAAFFFLELLMCAVYAAFSASLFFNKVLCYFSFAPCMYRAFSLGMHSCVVIGVYAASAVPMLIVFYIPACLIEIGILCILSFKCRMFAALNYKCTPSKTDIKEYYKTLLPFFICAALCTLLKLLSLILFASVLIGSI